MRTAIMTDSNSGMTSEQAKQRGIFLLPMPVIIDGETRFEGENITPEELFTAVQSDCKVTTSMPSSGDVIQMWEKILEKYDEIVHIPMSSGLSQSCNTARMLAEEYKGKVHVVDNGRISVTQAGSAVQAALMAEKGFSGKEIAEYLTQTRLNAQIYLMVDDLKYLKRGGRVTAASAAIGSLLNIKPVTAINDGPIEVVAKARGVKSALRTMLDMLRKDREDRCSWPGDETMACVATAGVDAETVEKLLEMIGQAFPECRTLHAQLPCSVGVHTGPGAIGFGLMHMHVP